LNAFVQEGLAFCAEKQNPHNLNKLTKTQQKFQQISLSIQQQIQQIEEQYQQPEEQQLPEQQQTQEQIEEKQEQKQEQKQESAKGKLHDTGTSVLWSIVSATISQYELSRRTTSPVSSTQHQQQGQGEEAVDNNHEIALLPNDFSELLDRASKSGLNCFTLINAAFRYHQMVNFSLSAVPRNVFQLLTEFHGMKYDNENEEKMKEALECLTSLDPFCCIVKLGLVLHSVKTINASNDNNNNKHNSDNSIHITDLLYLAKLLFPLAVCQCIHQSIENNSNDKDHLKVFEVVFHHIYSSSSSKPTSEMNDLEKEVLKWTSLRLISFLRRTSLFIYLSSLHDSLFSHRFQDHIRKFASTENVQQMDINSEFDSLKNILQLSNSTSTQRMVDWIRSHLPTMLMPIEKELQIGIALPLTLVSLEYNFQDLIAKYRDMKCKNCNTIPKTPGMFVDIYLSLRNTLQHFVCFVALFVV